MGGLVEARHNLGIFEVSAGNMDKAIKHYMFSAEAGVDESLTNIRKHFLSGDITKDDFEKALRSHKEAKDEMKSDQRDTAAALYGRNRPD
jgi:TPR repeat protein